MAGLIDYSKFQDYNRAKKKKRFRSWAVIFVILISTIIVIKNFTFNQEAVNELVSPVAKDIFEKGSAILNPQENSEALEKIVQHELISAKGKYAVAIKNLKTGERYYLNEHRTFDSASLYKLFVMATVFQKIQGGSLYPTDVLSQQISILNTKFRISSESAELTEGNISLPVQSALTRMITISDNYSALLLTEKVRLSQVALFLNQNSLTDSHVGTNGEAPNTSAYDAMSFFEKLYSEELSTKELTQNMLTLLKNQKLNTKIPKYLPRGTTVAHKTGELGHLSHDAGIVYSKNGDFIIVVLTETNFPAIANEKIAMISKNVYKHFSD